MKHCNILGKQHLLWKTVFSVCRDKRRTNKWTMPGNPVF
jgi:hypothetical protein